MVARKKRLKELNDKLAETVPPRKVHRDFTMAEFDMFTLELQNESATRERIAVMEELERTAQKMKKLALMMSDDDAQTFEIYAAGISMAVNVIADMRPVEDNVGCPECEAF